MKSLMTTTAVLTFMATAALAQNEATTPMNGTGMMGNADLSALPQVCRDAAMGGAATAATASTTETTTTGTTDSTDSTTGTAETGTDTGADADPTSGDTTTAQTDTATTDTTGDATGESTQGTMMASGGVMGAEIDMMHGRMAGLQGIQDKDLSFACTMIAHHQGAVNMARSVEASLQDETMKTMAATMISAHEAEIDQLTTWAEGHSAN